MAKIKLLSEDVINKISAGEVVERPKNIIKELVENAIDANSTKITVTIKNGGKDYISVLDNGTGILRDDVKNAFLPHATSKIQTDKDLYEVLSLGFRGEALSSISAVSKVTLTTKTDLDDTAIKMVVTGQSILEETEVPFNTGTKIEVVDLFKNVPARLKFLKKGSTESALISDFMQKIALCYPSISFKYVNNDTSILETSGNGNLSDVFYKIYGREIQNNLIPLSYKDDDIEISGLICKGQSYRANRAYESFFINNRIVKSDILRQGVEDAYKGRLPIGKFPIFAININVSPQSIDINVHPSKEEVRFSDDDKMYNLMYDNVLKSLKSIVAIPANEPIEVDKKIEEKFNKDNDLDFIKNIKPIENDDNLQSLKFNDSFLQSTSARPIETFEPLEVAESVDIIDIIDATKMLNIKDETKEKEIDIKVEEKVLQPKNTLYSNRFFKNVNIIGQVFNTYWIIEADNTSYIIDQHSAHEKILYEEFMYSYKNHSISTQMLLMPISIILTEDESTVLDENIELFSKFGFEIEIFGKNTYAIRSVPFVFESVNSPTFFLEILENLRVLGKNNTDFTDIFEEKIISLSCKSAVKANDKLSYKDAQIIIEKLTKLENPFNCPHGRPTIVEMTKNSIEKMFKRIV